MIMSSSFRLALGALLATTAACTLVPGPPDDDLIECYDGTICQGGEVCSPAGDGCATPAEIEACISRADGEACTTAAGDGLCLGGVCAQPRCGNGYVEPGEACDDGNLVSGDGCSEFCSLIVCGDAIVDPGEICDDGNLVNGDGCSITCSLEVCGDGRLDDAEICDDGNVISADGCSADCLSDETCGNGYVDDVLGEQCDPDPVLGGGAPCDDTCQLIP